MKVFSKALGNRGETEGRLQPAGAKDMWAKGDVREWPGGALTVAGPRATRISRIAHLLEGQGTPCTVITCHQIFFLYDAAANSQLRKQNHVKKQHAHMDYSSCYSCVDQCFTPTPQQLFLISFPFICIYRSYSCCCSLESKDMKQARWELCKQSL